MGKHQNAIPLFAVIACGVIATLTLGALPVFISRISQSFELSIQQSGVLAMSDLGGCAVGCMASLGIQNRFNWRRILIVAIGITCLGNLLSVWSSGYADLLLSRLLAGFGNGFSVSLVFAALCASANPDRNFGFYTFGQLIAQAITIPFFSHLAEQFGVDAIFIALTAASVAMLIVVPVFPTTFNAASLRKETETPCLSPDPGIQSGKAALGLVALGIYFWGFSSVWAFFELFAADANLSASLIGRALGLASIIGILGPVLVVASQPFLHRNLLLTLGIIAHAFSLLLLLNAGDYAIYLASGSLFLFSLNFVFPFQMGILAEHDRDGSMAVIALVVQLACLATGPYVGGLVHAQTGPAGVLAFSAISFGLALLLFLLAARKTPVIQA